MLQNNQMVKKAIQSLHTGKATISQITKTVNHGITDTTYTVVAKDIPCHLSYKLISSNNPTDTISTVKQETVLFIDPEPIVKDGSKIVVTQHGRTLKFKCSGVPSVYPSHQEIPLILDEVLA